jgi:uncharacterized protein
MAKSEKQERNFPLLLFCTLDFCIMFLFKSVFVRCLMWMVFLGIGFACFVTPHAVANGRYLIRQSTNTDCGPAALATLLTHYLDVPATEREIAELAGANQYGTTLAGLERATAAKGGGGDSFRMKFSTLRDQLAAYAAPVLVRLLLPEPHFVLVLHLDGETVMIADPASGNVMLPQKSFLKRWLISGSDEGYVFIAARPDSRTNVQRRDEIIAALRKERQLLLLQSPAVAMRR